MPELPEVDKMACQLNRWIAGNPVIHHVDVLRETKKYLPGTERRDIEGVTIQCVSRRGKFLVFETNRGLLVCHNAMSGFWDTDWDPWTFDYVEGKRKATDHDVRIKFHIGLQAQQGGTLQFHDARLFGSVRFYNGVFRQSEIRSLLIGPDAIHTAMSSHCVTGYRISGMTVNRAVYLGNMFKDDHRAVKEVLMDQSVIAGIGNIYTAEALWYASILPTKPASSLSPLETKKLSDSIDEVLRGAIARDLKYDGHIQVYRQKECSRCKTRVQKVKLAGRSTYFCVHCQV